MSTKRRRSIESLFQHQLKSNTAHTLVAQTYKRGQTIDETRRSLTFAAVIPAHSARIVLAMAALAQVDRHVHVLWPRLPKIVQHVRLLVGQVGFAALERFADQIDLGRIKEPDTFAGQLEFARFQREIPAGNGMNANNQTNSQHGHTLFDWRPFKCFGLAPLAMGRQRETVAPYLGA